MSVKKMVRKAFCLVCVAGCVNAAEFTVTKDVPYLGPDRAEKLDIYLPQGVSGKIPVVLYIHGGGWVKGSKDDNRPNCETLAGSGYAVVSINYKLNTKGTCDAYPQNIQDCKTALRFIRKEAATYGFDPQRVAVTGSSAGGHLAMLLAYTPDVAELNAGGLYTSYPVTVSCVINQFGISDVSAWGASSFVSKDSPQNERQHILKLVSPIAHITPNTVPTMVIHGTADPTVPFGQAEALVAKLEENGIPYEFIPVQNGAHAFPFAPHPRNCETDLRPAVLAFLKKYL